MGIQVRKIVPFGLVQDLKPIRPADGLGQRVGEWSVLIIEPFYQFEWNNMSHFAKHQPLNSTCRALNGSGFWV